MNCALPAETAPNQSTHLNVGFIKLDCVGEITNRLRGLAKCCMHSRALRVQQRTAAVRICAVGTTIVALLETIKSWLVLQTEQDTSCMRLAAALWLTSNNNPASITPHQWLQCTLPMRSCMRRWREQHRPLSVLPARLLPQLGLLPPTGKRTAA